MNKKQLLLGILSFTVFVVAVTTTVILPPKVARISSSSVSDITNSINQEVIVGDVSHTIASVQILRTIPASYTNERWKNVAVDFLAKDGFHWLHITGSTTNHSDETRTISSTMLNVQDASAHTFHMAAEAVVYIPDDMNPIYLEIESGKHTSWETYFMVPDTATGLALYVNDLTFFSQHEATIDLGL